MNRRQPGAPHAADAINTLLDQQRRLHRAIVSGGDADQLLRALPGREPLLRIYQHAYSTRLVAALRDNFGVLPMVMGDDAFDALAAAYVAAHPSSHASIRWFGDALPAFMAAHKALVPHAALNDLARMEWALRQAFDAADADVLDASRLGQLAPEDWPRLRFHFLPSVQLLDMHWSVEPLWRAMQAVEDGDEPEVPEPVAHAHALLVWRQGVENRWRSLDTLSADVLRAAMAGSSFAQLCEWAAQQVGDDQAAQAAVGALQSWLGDGLLRAVSLGAA